MQPTIRSLMRCHVRGLQRPDPIVAQAADGDKLAISLSSAIGSSRTRTPVALQTVLDTAAALPRMSSSPTTTFAFMGDEMESVLSRKITYWCRMTAWTGTSFPARS